MIEGRVFITGGAGTLGRAIVRKAQKEKWPAEFTIFSRDPVKHHFFQKEFPRVPCVLGDIADLEGLSKAMAGHNVVIHAAAMKHIPEGEEFPIHTYDVNVSGSINVALAAVQNYVRVVIGISTDKVCHPVNSYGCTKMMMERVFQEFSRNLHDTEFKLVRYGNVLGSTGSVVQVWRKMVDEYGEIRSTAANMTRFWLTDVQAVGWIETTFWDIKNGDNLIPLLPSTTMEMMHDYLFPEVPIRYLGLRPGEKIHEELVTLEEVPFLHAPDAYGYTVLSATVTKPEMHNEGVGYRSDKPISWLSREEILEMVGE